MFKKQEFDVLLIDKDGNKTLKGWKATYRACYRYINLYLYKSEFKQWQGGTANIIDATNNNIYYTRKIYKRVIKQVQ